MAAQDAHAEATLHEETLSELGLTEQPFQEDKKRQRFADSVTQRSRAALEQHLRFGDSIHLLIGDDGAGKTVLLSQLIKHCKSSIKPFVVKGGTEFEAEAFLAAVLHQLDAEDQAGSVEEHIEKLSPLLEKVTNDQYSVVLVVDDAHLAPFEEIAELVDIASQFENSDGKTARLLLTGTPALKQSITRIEDQFDDLNLKYSTNILPSFDGGRTREYLTSRLHQAGHADAFPFTDKAITKIQRDSGGLPGKINEGATNYLNGVYRSGAAGAANDTKVGGLLSAFEWPVLLLGAAALGAIGWGISMFFGNNPETDTTTAAVDIIKIEAPLESNDLVISNPIAETEILTPAVETQIAIMPEPTNTVVEPTGGSSTDLAIPTVQSPIVDTTIVSPEIESPVIVSQEVVNQPIQQPIVVESAPLVIEPEVIEKIVQIVPEAPTVPQPIITENVAVNKSISTIDAPNSVSVDVGTAAGVVVETTNFTDTDAASVDINENTNISEGIAIDSIATEVISDPSRAIENERWVLFQAPTKFTVQLATSRERGYIIDLAQTLEVKDPVAIYPFLTTNSQNPVFGLLSGLYDTRAEAIAAVAGMTENAKQFGVWIRPVSDLQDAIKRRQ